MAGSEEELEESPRPARQVWHLRLLTARLAHPAQYTCPHLRAVSRDPVQQMLHMPVVGADAISSKTRASAAAVISRSQVRIDPMSVMSAMRMRS